jgi:hypothetical protein
MAFRVEFYRNGRTMMITSNPKDLEDTIRDTAAGLERYDADRAFIRDMDGRGKRDTVIVRDDV